MASANICLSEYLPCEIRQINKLGGSLNEMQVTYDIPVDVGMSNMGNRAVFGYGLINLNVRYECLRVLYKSSTSEVRVSSELPRSWYESSTSMLRLTSFPNDL